MLISPLPSSIRGLILPMRIVRASVLPLQLSRRIISFDFTQS
jgi:hypothetical protein